MTRDSERSFPYTLAGFRQVTASAWQLVGLPMHDGLGMGRVFEDMPRGLRERIFTVAAETIDRLLKGEFDIRPTNVKHWFASTVFDPPPYGFGSRLRFYPSAETCTGVIGEDRNLGGAMIRSGRCCTAKPA